MNRDIPVNISLETLTPGKDISYDSIENAYYVINNEISFVLTAQTTPYIPEEEVGNIYTEVWEISNDILPLCRIDRETNTLFFIV